MSVMNHHTNSFMRGLNTNVAFSPVGVGGLQGLHWIVDPPLFLQFIGNSAIYVFYGIEALSPKIGNLILIATCSGERMARSILLVRRA